MQLTKNISDFSISISYLDTKIHKLAISEVSIMPKELIISSLEEFISNQKELEKMMHIVDISNSCGFYSRLNVPPQMRGKNIGSIILDETLKVCTEKNIFLFNTVNPYGDLNLEQLIGFYEKHGMKSISEEGVLVFSSHLNTNLKPRKHKL
jgi:GNAT superfamily N-acetyltransferase